ncbi:MAG: arginase family protein, partial [Gemmatimonadota bacterium]
GDFVLVLGGDCSVVLGCLLGAAARGRVGLAYLDAHADFATPQESRTGSVASMCLALATGRGASPLGGLQGARPLVCGEDVVLIGRRDHADAAIYGQDQLAAHGIVDVTHERVRERGAATVAHKCIEHLTRQGINGYWVHLDADLLDPSEMPAVDSPEPNGLSLDEVRDLLRPLVRHPAVLGMELTIYDPQLDPERTSAERLVTLLESVLVGQEIL